ncbi:MAG TPA: nucleoside 2-deoxyribosyltransferase domain-containing protein [Lacipirellulaceae bacterium]|nr:nucleoside 2-deoxyribosyltransferase domain-containing protein [Lacipirellulaceae bacterium]
MRYIEAPTEFEGNGPALFLAGGVSDVRNWQQTFVRLLPCGEYTLLNPRRAAFPVDDPTAEIQQIEWEVRYLNRATLMAFWFPPQTLCPLALFELGTCCASVMPMAVGVDPNYARRFDVEAHLRLQRPDVTIANTLESLATQVAKYLELKGAVW